MSTSSLRQVAVHMKENTEENRKKKFNPRSGVLESSSDVRKVCKEIPCLLCNPKSRYAVVIHLSTQSYATVKETQTRICSCCLCGGLQDVKDIFSLQ